MTYAPRRLPLTSLATVHIFRPKPQADCKSHIQVEAGSHACEHERSSSSSLSKSSNSSRDSFKDVDNKAFELLRSERARSRFAMQQYNNNQSNIIGSNMAYDDSRYSFTGAAQEATFSRSCSEVTPNMMLNFGGVMDPSAGFPGLGELPSNGMEPAVEQNLTGTFTGDLNSSSAYEVGDTDHGCLLQEMLQQHPPTPSARLPDSHSQVPAAASHGDWEDSLQALQEMVHLQQQHQQAHQIYNQPQMFHSPQISSAVFNGISNKFPGVESDLLNLLQFPRVTTPSFGYPGVRGKGPLYSTSTISGPVNTNYESRSILGYDPVHSHHYQNPAQRYFHKAPEASRLQGAPIMLVDLEQERDDLSGKSFGGKREQGAASGKGEPPRGVNHFATERQRREFLNEKYHTLRSLVPNPTKADRASIVADAIEYVKDLKRRVQEFQQLVQEKRRAAGDASSVKRRRPSMDGEPYNNTVESSTGPDNNGTHLGMQQKGNDGSYSPDGSHLRCSWLQRTSQNGAHVDVRIVHDEVTIKVNQRRSKSCLLFCVIAVLQDLQLDLVHASGATMGEHDVFLFNTKILKGSTTFAGYIAVKLLEALDRHLVI